MGARFENTESKVAGSKRGPWGDFLAQVRLILAILCCITAYLNPGCLGSDADPGRLLIFAYLTYSLFSLIIVRIHNHRGLVWQICQDAAEVVLTTLIIIYTGGTHSFFLGLYLFLLLAAACKWGLKGALLTSFGCAALLLSDLALSSPWSGRPPHLMIGGNSFAAMLGLSATLVLLAYMLGLLVEGEENRYRGVKAISTLVRSAVHEPISKLTIEYTVRSVREHFDADRVQLAIQEIRGEQAVAWELTRLDEEDGKGLQFWNLAESERQASFAMPPKEIRQCLGLNYGRLRVAGMGKQRHRHQDDLNSGLGRYSASTLHCDGLYDLQIVGEQHSPIVGSWSLLAISFSFERKWLGRLTVYNPHRGGHPDKDVRFLGDLVWDVGPAVYSKYLVARLRSRAQAKERVRLAQELHDGIVQSLIGLEMQIDLMRRALLASSDHRSLLQELGRIQGLFHDEVASVREEMQRIKPLEVQPGRLFEYLQGTVERFGRNQGISARFVAESQKVLLAPHVCAELVRIVQEALANVRKHSDARNVLVLFVREIEHYKLCVEDDGCGFGFTGRLSSAEFGDSFNCPAVVKERVHAIGGELVIESIKGSGARLEILVPLTANGRVFSGD